MKIFKNFKVIILIIITFIAVAWFILNSFIGQQKFTSITNLFSNDQKYYIKKYIFPYKLIDKQKDVMGELEATINKQSEGLVTLSNKLELIFKQSLQSIETERISEKKLSNGLLLKNYYLIDGFYAGIINLFAGSGYLDFHLDNLIVLSSRGVLGYSENLDKKVKFNQIKNNINEFIGFEQFNKEMSSSLKDLYIYDKKIFISYTDEIMEDCWNTSVIIGNIDFKEIEFKKLFSSQECVYSLRKKEKNIDGEFSMVTSGGRITNYDENHILLTVGDYRARYLSQEKDNINGKILKININDGSHNIITMGHRNPQGLYYDRENDFVLETEHGPFGGDEINLIEVDKINSGEILNYGWALASYGEHYGLNIEANVDKYKKYPLYKSHKKYGFVEPLHAFVPSIGISEITKIGTDKYVVSSMKDKSLYFFNLSKNNKLENLERVEVFERVRDLTFKDGKLYLFLENTPSIGVISIN